MDATGCLTCQFSPRMRDVYPPFQGVEWKLSSREGVETLCPQEVGGSTSEEVGVRPSIMKTKLGALLCLLTARERDPNPR